MDWKLILKQENGACLNQLVTLFNSLMNMHVERWKTSSNMEKNTKRIVEYNEFGENIGHKYTETLEWKDPRSSWVVAARITPGYPDIFYCKSKEWIEKKFDLDAERVLYEQKSKDRNLRYFYDRSVKDDYDYSTHFVTVKPSSQFRKNNFSLKGLGPICEIKWTVPPRKRE